MVKPHLWTRASKFHAVMGDDAPYLSQLVHDELRVVVRDGLDLDANISIFGSANICERNASERSYVRVSPSNDIFALSFDVQSWTILACLLEDHDLSCLHDFKTNLIFNLSCEIRSSSSL